MNAIKRAQIKRRRLDFSEYAPLFVLLAQEDQGLAVAAIQVLFHLKSESQAIEVLGLFVDEIESQRKGVQHG